VSSKCSLSFRSSEENFVSLLVIPIRATYLSYTIDFDLINAIFGEVGGSIPDEVIGFFI
jgi:hypothetical protein